MSSTGGPLRSREAGSDDPHRIARGRVHDAQLRESYRYCRLPTPSTAGRSSWPPGCWRPRSGPPCIALYGFARYADDIRRPRLDADTAERARCLSSWRPFFDGADHADDRKLAAVLHTARTYHIPLNLFDDFLASMRMDLTVTDYLDRAALNGYMRGSAEVIGLQMLPILGNGRPEERGRAVRRGIGHRLPADQLPA